MDSLNESRERLARVEAKADHIEQAVGALAERQMKYEALSADSFAVLRENGIRQQIATENLVKAIQEQTSQHSEDEEKVAKRIEVLEEKLSNITSKIIGVTIAAGAVWVLVGKKLMLLLGMGV